LTAETGSRVEYAAGMNAAVTHDRRGETIEEKARWFQSLSMTERMEMLCAFTDLALEINPSLKEYRRAQSPEGRVQVVSRT